MFRFVVVLVLLVSCQVLRAAEPTAFRRLDARQAQSKYHRAVKLAEGKHAESLSDLRVEYVADLKKVLKVAMSSGDLEEANRIAAEIEKVATRGVVRLPESGGIPDALLGFWVGIRYGVGYPTGRNTRLLIKKDGVYRDTGYWGPIVMENGRALFRSSKHGDYEFFLRGDQLIILGWENVEASVDKHPPSWTGIFSRQQ